MTRPLPRPYSGRSRQRPCVDAEMESTARCLPPCPLPVQKRGGGGQEESAGQGRWPGGGRQEHVLCDEHVSRATARVTSAQPAVASGPQRHKLETAGALGSRTGPARLRGLDSPGRLLRGLFRRILFAPRAPKGNSCQKSMSGGGRAWIQVSTGISALTNDSFWHSSVHNRLSTSRVELAPAPTQPSAIAASHGYSRLVTAMDAP